MRYLIQLAVMLSDLVIVVVCGYVVSSNPKNPLFWIIVALTVQTWLNQGGFMAWDLKLARQFLAYAKKIGL